MEKGISRSRIFREKIKKDLEERRENKKKIKIEDKPYYDIKKESRKNEGEISR